MVPMCTPTVVQKNSVPHLQGWGRTFLGNYTKFITSTLVQILDRSATIGVMMLIALFGLVGCGGGESPTRTPVPTWTATPNTGQPVAENQPAAQPATENQGLSVVAPAAGEPQAATPTPVPSTATPLPTFTPTVTPTPLPSATPTETVTPSPSPTPDFAFELEAAEKFPTESLAADVVRIFLYAYSPSEFGLRGYSLAVHHNDEPLVVDAITDAGLPGQTRAGPSQYTRFTNMSAIFVGPQTGLWEVQLIDERGAIVGPATSFELTADEITREIYVRYKLK